MHSHIKPDLLKSIMSSFPEYTIATKGGYIMPAKQARNLINHACKYDTKWVMLKTFVEVDSPSCN